jgi:hypothetical protein
MNAQLRNFQNSQGKNTKTLKVERPKLRVLLLGVLGVAELGVAWALGVEELRN